MELLNKLTIKNLKLNKKRTIVTIIGIMLSVALIMAVTTLFFSAHASLIKFEIRQKGDFHYSFKDLTQEEIDELRQNRRIKSLYQTTEVGYAKLEEIQNEYKPYVYVQGYDETAMKTLNNWLIEGRLPENDREILISEHLIYNGKVKLAVGEELTLEVGKRTSEGHELHQDNPFSEETEEKLIESEEKTYTIVGMIERLPYEMEPYSAPGYTAITSLSEAEGRTDVYVRYDRKGLKDHLALTAGILGIDAEAFTALNTWQIYLRLTAEEENQVYEEISKARYEWQINDYLIMLETGIIGDSAMRALGMAVLMVLVIIVFTSIYCIKNSFDISITEKIRQYGMLSSIGATRKQIRKNVYYEAMLLGAAGIPLGLLSGVFAAYVLVHVSNYLLMVQLGMPLIFQFSGIAAVFSVGLGFLTVFLSARRSAKKAGRISPIQAIRNSGEIKIRESKIKAPAYISRIFGVGGEIAYKNLKRSRKKYRTTVVSIVISVSVFIATTSFANFAYDMIQVEYKTTDYNIQLNYTYDEEYEGMAEEIRELPDVEKFCSMFQANSMEVKNASFTKDYLEYYEQREEGAEDYLGIYVLLGDAFQDYAESLGLSYEEVKEQGVLLNELYVSDYDEETQIYTETQMEKYTFQAGDVIKGIASPYHEEYRTEVEIPLAALTRERPLGVHNYSGNAILILGEAYCSVFQQKYCTEEIYIYSADAMKTQEEIEKLLGGRSVNIYNTEESVQEVKSLYTLVSIFMYGFIIVISLIGVTNIFNTITTNMNLRRREFAMLKSIGMTAREFHRMIRLESFFYGMKSLLIGIPAGCALSFLLHKVMMTGDIELMYYIPVNAILISVLAVFLLVTMIMRYSIMKIEKQNIIETIRNENI